MTHANALLTPRGRLALARCVVDDRWPLRRAAERFQVSPTTADRWATRYRQLGEDGMVDRSCRPARSPAQTPQRRERRIIGLRVDRRWGPARIGWHLGIHPSTVHRVLTRWGLARLRWLDRPTGRVIRRYERAAPGELIHIDVKKLGKIPDGGGHRTVGRQAGRRNGRATTTARNNGHPVIGYHYLHTAVDDHSRLAYAEILTDETKQTAAGFWARCSAFFTTAGAAPQRVLTDNGSCYRSGLFTDALAITGTVHIRTRPYRPQTNGKVERFHRTLADEWAYAQPYRTDAARVATFSDWLHTYNYHRGHTALGRRPPAARVTNLSGQNT